MRLFGDVPASGSGFGVAGSSPVGGGFAPPRYNLNQPTPTPGPSRMNPMADPGIAAPRPNWNPAPDLPLGASAPSASQSPMVEAMNRAVSTYRDFPLSVRFKKGGGMVTGKWRF